jgi:O-antigen ligase
MSERFTFNLRPRLRQGPVSPPAPALGRGLLSRAPRERAAMPVQPERDARTDWAWLGLLGFTVVLFVRPQEQFAPLQALHLAEVFAIVGILGMLLGRAARGRRVIEVTPEVLGVTALGAAMLASIPLSYWPGGSVAVFLDVYVKLLLIFVLLAATLDRPERLDRLTFLVVLLSGYIALRAVIDGLRGANLVEGGRVAGAVRGIFGNPNDLAMNMVVFLPFALVWAFRRRVPLPQRAAAGLCAALMLATIVLTRSRGGAVGLVAMMGVLALGSLRVRPAIAATMLAAVILAAPLAPASFWERMSSIADAQKDATGSRQARLDLMQDAWNVFLDHPILGIGLGQFVNYDPSGRRGAWHVTHNAYLQVATELGVVGLAPFIFLLVSGARAAREARRRVLARLAPPRRAGGAGPPRVLDPPDERLVAAATAAGPSLVGWFVCALFGSIALNWTLYYVLAVAAATRAVARAADVAPERVAA